MDFNEFSQLCRICSCQFEQGVAVFGEEGKKLYLQAKLQKYLYITVSVDDKLPKRLCEDCYERLDGISKFAAMAIRNQETLDKKLVEIFPASERQSEKCVVNQGLLHSYLTKGINENKRSAKIDDTEEVEVRVDPMQFLQYNSENEHETETDNNSEDCSDCEGANNVSPKKCKVQECAICKKLFTTEASLHNHIWWHLQKNKRPTLKPKEITDSNGTSEFSCPICTKQSSTKENLRVHLETHRPKGKYGCNICGRIFKTQCNLHRHKEYHEGVQFTCPVCGRVYPTNSTLRAHSITHSDLRPHKCLLCDKTFKRNQDLKFHINQHTGARPYQCPYCPKAFASSGNCFSHRKRMHPVEVERDRERAAKILQ